ncbi:MAG: D-sedoheptulose 7-phosphate isomerase [Armatimonadetes bacterium]|nr:D-sedoheptulose 7-phosphate isomerase [Armatimonadota bacterium]
MPRDWNSYAADHLRESIRVKEAVIERCIPDLMKVAQVTTDCFGNGKKVLICGNGGSAADAQHLAAEFISTLSTKFPRKALPAIALTTDSSTMTARANDYGFDEVFSRQVEAFGTPGDILISISTSGGSKNCLRAMEEAKLHGMINVALVGGTGGKMAEVADYAIVVPSDQTMHVQESHLALYHIYCYVVERQLNPEQAEAELLQSC